jgi:predicted CXXCH cytochrome family protein
MLIVAAAVTAGALSVAHGALSTTPSDQTPWYWQNPLPQGNRLLAVDASEGPDVWAVGESGTVLYSADDGIQWVSRYVGVSSTLRAVDFVDSQIGWVVGDGSVVRKTDDGGLTWSPQIPEAGLTAQGISMVTSQTGWMVGASGAIRKTLDGGSNWLTVTTTATESLTGVSAVSATRAWAVGADGAIYGTTDGSNWSAQYSGVSQQLNGVQFIDSQTGYVVGDDGVVLKTTDGGSAWSAWPVVYLNTSGVPTLLVSPMRAVSFRDASTGWIAGDDGLVLFTDDGGVTWSAQQSGAGRFNGVSAADGLGAHLVGDSGATLRTEDDGTNWLSQVSEGLRSPSDFRDLAFNGSAEGWVVGRNGAIAHTHNGGNTWDAQLSGVSADLFGVDFVTDGSGWVVGSGGIILTSLTHETWGIQASPVTSTLRGVDFADSAIGWAVGDQGVILKTADGGIDWGQQLSGVSASIDLHGVSAIDTQTVFAWGDEGTVLRTTDGGSSWVTASVGAEDIFSGSFISAQTGWVGGDSGLILKTADGGAGWSALSSGTGDRLTALDFVDAQSGYAVGVNGAVRVTVDGGSTWDGVSTGTTNDLYGVWFADADNGWLIGEGGTILRSTDDSAPSTTLMLDPASPDGNDGWYRNAPLASLLSNEPGLTSYSWVSSAGPWQTYTVPATPPGEGTFSLSYYSIDQVDNRENVRSHSVKVDSIPPTTPSAPSASVQSATGATLAWGASNDLGSGFAFYEVRNYGSLIGTSPVNSMTLSSLSTETAYSLTVGAVDVAGNTSAASGAVQISTLAAVPRAPVAIAAVAAGARGVILNWGESTGTVSPVSYRVWRSTSGAPFSAIATISASGVRSYVDTDAPRFAQIRYAVSVADERGDGAMSAPTPLSTTSIEQLDPPAKLSARNTASVTLTWTPAPAADGYHVYRSTSSTGTETTLTISGPVTAPTYHDSTTAAFTEYWFSVATVDASGNVGAPGGRVYIRTEAETSTTTTDTPHGIYSADTNMCAVCHNVHAATGELLLQGVAATDAPLCLSCHDGTSASDVRGGFMDDSRTSRHPVPMGADPGALQCSSCHAVHFSRQSGRERGLLRAGTVTSGNGFCYECHDSSDDGTRGDLRGFEGSGHATGVPEPASGTRVVCLSCHVAHTSRESGLYPYTGDDRCLGCHSTGVLSSGGPDILTRLSGDGPGTRHDLRSGDASATGSRLDCSNCHEVHTSSSTTPCVDPDRPTTTNTISASGVTLCLRCHDGALPTSADTSGWAPAPLAAGGTTVTADIASVWGTNVHGGAPSSAPMLNATLGYAKGDSLVCASCHDSHGSNNRFALLETVVGTGTATTAGNLTVTPAGAGWDLRFFCDSCHDLTPASHTAADISGFPVDCTASGCHTHEANGL